MLLSLSCNLQNHIFYASQTPCLQLRLGSSHHGLGHNSPLDLTSSRLGHHLGEIDLLNH